MLPRALLAGLLGACLPAVAAAAPSSEGVIQVRKYGFSDELRLSFGTMPLDPFQKGWTVGLSHTHHFDSVWAWETLHVAGALLTSTSLRDELIGTFARRPQEFAAPRFIVTTGLEATPLYGKQVMFNRDTAHLAMLVGVYGGVMFGDRDTLERTLEDIRPSVGGGLGFRAYLSQTLSARLDARLFASFRTAIERTEEAELETVALVTLSLSFGWGDAP